MREGKLFHLLPHSPDVCSSQGFPEAGTGSSFQVSLMVGRNKIPGVFTAVSQTLLKWDVGPQEVTGVLQHNPELLFEFSMKLMECLV